MEILWQSTSLKYKCSCYFSSDHSCGYEEEKEKHIAGSQKLKGKPFLIRVLAFQMNLI